MDRNGAVVTFSKEGGLPPALLSSTSLLVTRSREGGLAPALLLAACRPPCGEACLTGQPLIDRRASFRTLARRANRPAVLPLVLATLNFREATSVAFSNGLEKAAEVAGDYDCSQKSRKRNSELGTRNSEHGTSLDSGHSLKTEYSKIAQTPRARFSLSYPGRGLETRNSELGTRNYF